MRRFRGGFAEEGECRVREVWGGRVVESRVRETPRGAAGQGVPPTRDQVHVTDGAPRDLWFVGASEHPAKEAGPSLRSG